MEMSNSTRAVFFRQAAAAAPTSNIFSSPLLLRRLTLFSLPSLHLNHHPNPTGVSLAPARRPATSTSPSTGSRSPLTVEANAKTCLGCTKRGTRRRATRTSGFRARMATPTGRGVLKARRKKGRKVLCTKTLYKK